MPTPVVTLTGQRPRRPVTTSLTAPATPSPGVPDKPGMRITSITSAPAVSARSASRAPLTPATISVMPTHLLIQWVEGTSSRIRADGDGTGCAIATRANDPDDCNEISLWVHEVLI